MNLINTAKKFKAKAKRRVRVPHYGCPRRHKSHRKIKRINYVKKVPQHVDYNEGKIVRNFEKFKKNPTFPPKFEFFKLPCIVS